jgi:hypothetical protein
MKDTHCSGIYIFQCLHNCACYVGQAKVVNIRIGSHRSKLNRGCHEVPLLQADWNQYGREGFAIWKRHAPADFLDELEAETTIRTNALEHLGGYNRSLILERYYSARIRDTETKLRRKQEFAYLPHIVPWSRIHPLQISIFCQFNVPMVHLHRTSLCFKAYQLRPVLQGVPEGFDLVID